MPLIHTAAIEHMSGMDMFADITAEGLNKKIADYCRSHWETVSWRSDDPRPEEPADDEEAIEIYFYDHENDSLTTDACSIPEPSREVISKALHLADWAKSLEKAIDQCGGSWKWEHVRRMTVEELGLALSHNGVTFTSFDQVDAEQKRRQHEDTAIRVTDALPFLK